MKCEKCGQEHDSTFGSGRFCSRQCANSRIITEETKEKIKLGMSTSKKFIDAQTKRFGVFYGGEIKTERCKVCQTPIKRRTKFGLCKACLHNDESYRKKLSDSIKLSMKTNYYGWTPTGESYPEKFWTNVLQSRGIRFEREKKVDRFYLDFYLEKNGKKIDFEIDGKQHKYKDRIKHDLDRTKFLVNLGYIVYRLDWVAPTNDERKEKVKADIERFISFYNAL